MIKTETRWICDGCEKDITKLCSRTRTFVRFDDHGNAFPVAYDFCNECNRSFCRWLQSRKEKNPGDEMTHQDQL